MATDCHNPPQTVVESRSMIPENKHITNPASVALVIFACALLVVPAVATAAPVPKGPVKVEAMKLPRQAADPYAVEISLGPRHEYDPVYFSPSADACPVMAFRVLVLRYANHDNLVVEELEYAGTGCRELRVRSSHTINGVRLGYILGEGSQFAKGLRFVGWESWDICVIESRNQEFRLLLGRDGEIRAEKTPRTEPAN